MATTGVDAAGVGPAASDAVQVRYRAASTDDAWWVAVDGDALAVLAPSATARTAEAVWRHVGDGGIAAVLEALTGAFGTSLTAIPPFAVAVAEHGGIRLAVRGQIEVVVDAAGAPDGPLGVSGDGVATWVERFVAGASRVTVSPGGAAAEDAAMPLRSGVARADLVVATLVPAPAQGAPAAPAAPAVPEEISRQEEPESSRGTSAAEISSRTAAPAPAPAAPEPEPAPADTSADTWMPVQTAAAEATPAPLDEYDLLWGETVARPIAAAASAAATEPDDTAASTPAAPAPSPDEPPAPPVRLGDHDGATISVAEARALRAAERELLESTDGVPPRRPARGRIVLSTGRVVELERAVIIGRRPKSTRTTGSELPTLVAVDSPEQDISRNHVEIRAEGEHVLATDLDTTNGTVLLRAGSDPVRLHPGEPTMVITGDVLDLGDGVTVTFEDLP